MANNHGYSNLARAPAMGSVPNGTCHSLTGLTTPWNDYIYVPCNLTAIENGQHSACCADGDTCLTNGLCKYNPSTPVRNFNTYWRIGCTDPTYQDPACPRQCEGKETPERNVHVVFECPGDGQWCCGTGNTTDYGNTMSVNTTCCNIPDLAFRDEARKSYTTAQSDWQSVVDLQTFAAQAESTAASTASTTPQSAESTSTQTVSHTSLSLASATASPSSQPTSAPFSSNPTALGVGLGLGIPLLIAALALLVWLLYRHQHRHSARHAELEGASDDVRHAYPHEFAVEKSGREVPAELSGERDVHEMGGGAG